MVRVTTELVQTDVTVVDKQGRPVKDLKQEQFQLFVDGKQQPISFFERVTTGSASEEAQLAAARGSGIALEKATGVVPSDRGRAIFFFVDDLHMAPPNLIRARRAILEYLDRELGQNDQAAITSTSGQLGFLQQMTDNKLVLKRAAEKLKSSVKGGDMDFPPMTEIEAFMMLERGGSALMSYFIEQLVKDGIPRISAENLIRTRAKALLQQAYHSTKGTLSTLETLARRSGQLPGRKLIFFISDGFVMNLSDAGMIGRLHNITDAAARNNVVIYALDSRGLMTGKMDDPTAAPMFDPGGRLASVENQDMSISQEPLQVLASSTGGRAFLNSNSLKEGFSKGVKETSAYYLLAWRPLNEEQRNKKFRRIEVKIIG
ncbi:MAG TPA: VWA domain-containing protein, partial [Pyrinomonadaceae bacterium]|nr:VWA domain-containing protein [Pyrinomonadaceae bacterium]